MQKFYKLLIVGILCIAQSYVAWADQPVVLRLGFFPNITHAQALYAKARGTFDKALGAPVKWTAFNAGPTAIEAILGNEIDATFTGPGPAINGYIRSRGEKYVIVAGAASGGAALVVRKDSGIKTSQDFNGKTIATPQLGNTQDIAARTWLRGQNYKTTAEGGTVNIIPLSNPDQLMMFKKKEIDGAWTIEPWVSRLELEAGGQVFLDEKTLWPEGKYATTLLIVSRSFLAQHPDTVRTLLRALIEVTQTINANPAAAAKTLNEQIRKQTGRALREDVIKNSLRRVNLTWEPMDASIYKGAAEAHEIHFLRAEPDLAGIFDLKLLNEALAEKGLPAVREQSIKQ
jgi:NitT/TauT family transport system substrate-binding protein